MTGKDIQLLINEYELKKEQYDEVMKEIEETCKKIKNVDKVLEIKGEVVIIVKERDDSIYVNDED